MNHLFQSQANRLIDEYDHHTTPEVEKWQDEK